MAGFDITGIQPPASAKTELAILYIRVYLTFPITSNQLKNNHLITKLAKEEAAACLKELSRHLIDVNSTQSERRFNGND
jgi:hypothetical protein